MSHHYPRRSLAQLSGTVLRAIPWRLLIILPILAAIAIPTFVYGMHMGVQILPSVTNAFYNLTGPTPPPAPTPQPPLLTNIPQFGKIAYTVQEGDNCVDILSANMFMSDAGAVFSETKPAALHALGSSIGHDCHTLQPGNKLKLSPQYPLVAFGGPVLKVEAQNSMGLVPASGIAQNQLDCSQGCTLQVKLTEQFQVTLSVQTTLQVHPGSWVWVQAMLQQQRIRNVEAYPYVSPDTSINGMSMKVCDFQVDQTYDTNSTSCDQLKPNTIDDDRGSWLFGVAGSNALDHWKYGIKELPGTSMLLWLSLNRNGQLVYHKGNPVYRYDEDAQMYVPAS